jgi:curli biogenesis system outer membrane secretion channel CsgG
LVFVFTACATIEKPEVKTVEEKTPQVSKSIKQKSEVNKTGLKRKVAIARFSNETRYGQSFFIDKDNDRIGKQAVDILSSKLLETNKFILLERADLEKINKELALENYSPLKNMADFLVIGSVTEFGRKETGEVGIFSRTKKQTAFAKVHVRLVDVYSGEVMYSEEGMGEAYAEAGTVFGVGGQSGYDSTLNDKALEAAITNLSSNIIENLLDKEWRSYILGYDNGNLIIAGGLSQNIQSGEVFSVIQKGKEIRNPQTNTSITLPGKKIAKVKVLSSAGKAPKYEVSFCEITEGDLSDYIKNNNFSGLYISEGE